MSIFVVAQFVFMFTVIFLVVVSRQFENRLSALEQDRRPNVTVITPTNAAPALSAKWTREQIEDTVKSGAVCEVAGHWWKASLGSCERKCMLCGQIEVLGFHTPAEGEKR